MPIVLAHQEPPGCTDFGLSLQLTRSISEGHLGDSVDFTARVTNAASPACDASDIEIVFTWPDGTTQTLATGIALQQGQETAGFPVNYTVSSDDVTNNRVTALVTATGLIHASAGEDPWTATQKATVSVPPVVLIDGGATVRTSVMIYTVTGTSEDAPTGADVTVTITGLAPETTKVQADGTWSVTFLLPLGDGPLSVTAEITYGVGNVSNTATQTLDVDRTPPVITIHGGPAVTTSLMNPPISGSTDAPENSIVTVIIDGNMETTIVQPDGTWSLIWPHPLAAATYPVTASVADDLENTATANQDLTVSFAPVAVNDAYTMTQGQTLTVDKANGVLKNDTHPLGDDLTASPVGAPANGVLTLEPDGSFTYTPAANFTGIDSFTYIATDNITLSDLATVQITVEPKPAVPPPPPTNRRPNVRDDVYTMRQDEELTVTAANGLLSNDSDPDGDLLRAEVISWPAHGSLTLNPDGSFIYSPDLGFAGTDGFSYRAFDGTASSDIGTVTITVTPTPPVVTEAKIGGVLIDAATGRPIANATVTLSADLDQDGVIDFSRSVQTDAAGRYEIAVPREDFTYTCQITMQVQTASGPVTLTTTQQTTVTATSSQQLFDATEKIAGRLFFRPPSRTTPLRPDQVLGPGQQIQATLMTLSGEALPHPVTVQADGTFEAEGVAPGAYRILFQVVSPGGSRLAGTMMETAALGAGALAVGSALIDPTGQVTDALTGLPVADAKVTLYWADSPRNRQAGRMPHTVVNLPALPGFAPAGNAVPQMTTADGIYAWMVYPDGDYYIHAEKAGYRPRDSRNEVIHVHQTALTYDFQLEPLHQLYMQGYPDGTFRPDRSITRAEIAAIFARLLHPTPAQMPLTPYSDVPSDHWARHHIELVRQHQIMGGDPDQRFRPEAPITRAELTAVIARYLGLGTGGRTPFTDTAGHWAEASIRAVYTKGLITGYVDGTFRPEQVATRAEAATLINRLLGQGPLTGRPGPTWVDVPVGHWAYQHIEEASVSHSAERGLPGTEHWTGDLDEATW